MEYELKYGKSEQVLLQQIVKNKQSLPDFIANKPKIIHESLQFYLQAFFMLESERPIGFGIYPIPITKIIQLAQLMGYTDYKDMYDFIYIIRELDSFTITYYNKKK